MDHPVDHPVGRHRTSIGCQRTETTACSGRAASRVASTCPRGIPATEPGPWATALHQRVRRLQFGYTTRRTLLAIANAGGVIRMRLQIRIANRTRFETGLPVRLSAQLLAVTWLVASV